ncbi:MAG: hypothetical protein ACTSRP_01775, partial [Candidatus Helarchaeota archaeon]
QFKSPYIFGLQPVLRSFAKPNHSIEKFVGKIIRINGEYLFEIEIEITPPIEGEVAIQMIGVKDFKLNEYLVSK